MHIIRVSHTILFAFRVFSLPLQQDVGYILKRRVKPTWPIQGPHAFARTTTPTSCKVLVIPSRSIVARICSEPGVHRKGTLAVNPAPCACFAMSATLVLRVSTEMSPLRLHEESLPSPHKSYSCKIQLDWQKARLSNHSLGQMFRTSTKV